MRRPIRPSLILLLPLCLSGCMAAGPTKTVTRSIELSGADSASVELKMTAGELHVAGGAAGLLDAVFAFNVPEWEPTIDYQRNGTHGALTVRQGGGSVSFRNTKNSWDLRLNDTVPVTLTTSVGAGEGTLVLGSMNLQSVQVDAGAGEFTLDLRGTPKHSYDVRVNASVGETHISLPKSVGIIATATAGVGGVNVHGLEKHGDTWVNFGHEQDPVVIHVDVKGGVGEINLSAE